MHLHMPKRFVHDILVAEFRRDNSAKRSAAKKRKSAGGNGENGEAGRAIPPDFNSSPPAPSGEDEDLADDAGDMQIMS
jgi:hypothetical protein